MVAAFYCAKTEVVCVERFFYAEQQTQCIWQKVCVCFYRHKRNNKTERTIKRIYPNAKLYLYLLVHISLKR